MFAVDSKEEEEKNYFARRFVFKDSRGSFSVFFVLVSIAFRFDECKIKSSHGWLAGLSKLTPVNYSHT